MATKKTTTKKSATAKVRKPAAKKSATAKAAAPKKAPAKKPAAKAVKKPAADGAAGNVHEKVQLWKDGPYWATTNIGAEKPEDFGYYFWWGDTVGYKREKDKWVATDGSSSDFSFEGSNTYTVPSDDECIEEEYYDAWLEDGGWITDDRALVPEHDAAHVQWGGGWRMPTEEELQNLVDKCDWTWKTVNGVKGYVVCGKGAYASASIFLPAAATAKRHSLGDAGSRGNYWSSVPHSDIYLACGLDFDSNNYRTFSYNRSNGHPIRPVQ